MAANPFRLFHQTVTFELPCEYTGRMLRGHDDDDDFNDTDNTFSITGCDTDKDDDGMCLIEIW